MSVNTVAKAFGLVLGFVTWCAIALVITLNSGGW